MRDWKQADARYRNGALVVSRGVTIVGSLTVEGDMLIEGTIDGDIRCGGLQIAERGAVEGLIVAESVVILGEFRGMIYAREVVLAAAVRSKAKFFTTSSCLRKAATSRASRAATAIRC